MKRLISSVVTVAAVAGAAGFIAAPSASAAPECTAEYAYDKICLFENGGQYLNGKSRIDLYSRSSWANITYTGTSTALYKGDGVLTNVSGATNWDPDSRVAIYYNSNYAGPCFTIKPHGIVFFRSVGLSNGRVANDNMNSHRFNVTCGSIYG
ncbi:hypothetical protein LRE75_26935 [Streptomyces sp. 372A]|uniref:hypothetical protein n=1 Tax=unclassified Streptomyces TaxID=2593676 RepID=UPI0013C5EA50|nr:hypothetical protein [Streptomyces sp. SID9727]NEC64230.1 hypothetical protein [Streptomyces sp. SID9727]